MRNSTFWWLAALAGAAIGPAGAAILALAPGPLGLALAGGFLCWLTFTALPWLVLPVGVLGGAVVAWQVADGDTATLVTVHVCIVAAAVLALLTRRIGRPGERRTRTPADLPMLLVGVVALLGAGYGLTLGQPAYDVLVGSYHLAVVPAYFFLATATLTSPRRRQAGAVAYVSGAAVLAALGLATPGQHGGLLSALALVPLLAYAAGTTQWHRAGLGLLGGLFGADIVLSGQRTVWIAVGVAVVVLLVRGSLDLRRCVGAAMLACVALLAGGVAFSDGMWERSSTIVETLSSPVGDLGPETEASLLAFADSPLVGHGAGHRVEASTPSTALSPPPASLLPPSSSGAAVTPPDGRPFWVTVLATVGVLGLAFLLWPLALAVLRGLALHDGAALGSAALLCGFVASAVFAGPGDGHWELGLLGALVWLSVPVRAAAQASRADAEHPLQSAPGPAPVGSGAVAPGGHA